MYVPCTVRVPISAFASISFAISPSANAKSFCFERAAVLQNKKKNHHHRDSLFHTLIWSLNLRASLFFMSDCVCSFNAFLNIAPSCVCERKDLTLAAPRCNSFSVSSPRIQTQNGFFALKRLVARLTTSLPLLLPSVAPPATAILLKKSSS